MRKIIVACAVLGAMNVAVQAQGVMVDQYGNVYPVISGTPEGVMTGISPFNGMPVIGNAPPVYPESDPSMFGQVRPDGSIIGVGQ